MIHLVHQELTIMFLVCVFSQDKKFSETVILGDVVRGKEKKETCSF